MLFLDMDGVIALHEPAAYIERDDQGPLFLKRGYFASLTPDVFIQRMIHILNINDVDFAILSTVVPTDNDKSAQIPITDKRNWLNANFAGFDKIDEDKMLFSVKGQTTKAEIAEDFLSRKITRADILIDDFNEELSMWQKAGGCAVKYINGANNYNSWAGKCITKPMSAEETARYNVDFLQKIESDAQIKK